MSNAGRPSVYSDDQIKRMIAELHGDGINPSYPAMRRANPDCCPHTSRFRKLRDQWYAETGKGPLASAVRVHPKTAAFRESLKELDGIKSIEDRTAVVRAAKVKSMSDEYNEKIHRVEVTRGRVKLG